MKANQTFTLSLICSLCLVTALWSDIRVYQYSGVDVTHAGKKVTLEREIDPKCLEIPINNKQIWEGDYANKEIPKECKAMFVTSVGQIQPISLHPEVETYGEMEVMHFFKKMQKHEKTMMLVDTRAEDWFAYRTIPGAVNIPHYDITDANVSNKDFQHAMNMLGIKIENGKFDFSEAKEIVLFCNGAWCSQSPVMIKELMALGYPAKKLKWYRGGMHDWLTLSMTSTHKRK